MAVGSSRARGEGARPAGLLEATSTGANYYDEQTLRRCDALREVLAIRSGEATIRMNLYPGPEAEAPVVMVNHGAAGY